MAAPGNQYRAFPVALVVKNPPANAGGIRDASLIPGSGRSPGGGQGNPLQDSCLENPMDRRAWLAAVHGPQKSWTQLMTKNSNVGRNPVLPSWVFPPVSCLHCSHITRRVSKRVVLSPYNKRFSETSAEYPTI